jgi:uncharacterized protein involved in outer membrane biogenesis
VLWSVLAVVAGLGALVGVFLHGVTVRADVLREPLERVLTRALGAPTRIEGPVRLRTGLSVQISADALVVADPVDADAPPLARGTAPSARIDLGALFGRVVILAELTGDRLELQLARAADGRANWTPLFAPSSGGGSFSFGGIQRIHIDHVEGTYRSPGRDRPLRFAVASFEGSLGARTPVTAHGITTVAGHAMEVDLRTASLADLAAARDSIPFTLSLASAGAQLELKGNYSISTAALDASFTLMAANADAPLAAAEVAVHDAGALDARGQLRVSASEATVTDLVLRLGQSSASGTVRVAWGSTKPHLALNLAAERIDLAPFVTAPDATPEQSDAEALLKAIHAIAIGPEIDAKLAIAELSGAGTPVHDLRLDAHNGASTLALHVDGDVSGISLTGTLDYTEQAAQRTLTARLEGGQMSTGALPPGARPTEISGAVGNVRGTLTATGDSTRALIAAARGSLEAHNLRLAWHAPDGQTLEAQLDSALIKVVGERATTAEMQGRIADDRCTAQLSGGAVAQLVAGERWPIRLQAACGTGRLSGDGYVALQPQGAQAALTFDGRARRVGALGQVLGLPADVPLSLAARGRLTVDDGTMQLALDDARLGGTAGRGEATVSLDGKAPPRVQLVLKSADLDQLASLVPGQGKRPPADPLERTVLPANVTLPDVDFDLAADSVRLANDTLHQVSAKGATRDGRLPETAFRLAWRGVPVSGGVALDLRSARPTIAVHADARDADLSRVMTRFRERDVALKAGRVSVRANGSGARLVDLLESGTVEAALEQGTLEHADRLLPWLGRSSTGSASLSARPGQPTQLTLRGRVEDGTPVKITGETGGLVALARAASSVSLHGRLGDERVEVSGKVARSGPSELHVRARGKQLDRLGRLLDVALPSVGPYDVAGTVRFDDDALQVSDIDVQIGQTHVLGQLSGSFAGKLPQYTATLRAPLVRLKDLGAERWLGGGASPTSRSGPSDTKVDEWLRGALNAFEAKVKLDVKQFDVGDERFSGGRIEATVGGGVLHTKLDRSEVRAGAFAAEAYADARGPALRVEVQLVGDGVEFGPLARTLDPTTALAGQADLWIDLSAVGPATRLPATASGVIDVAVYPRDLQTGRVDLWGAGVLRQLFWLVERDTKSRANCAVASFDIEHGVARSRAFFADTTHTRIVGELKVNLATGAIGGRITPESKAPELFAVAPPLTLGGTIESPTYRVTPKSLAETPLRFAQPLVTYPLGWLTQKNPPTNGTPDCRKAFREVRHLKETDTQKAANGASPDAGKGPTMLQRLWRSLPLPKGN